MLDIAAFLVCGRRNLNMTRLTSVMKHKYFLSTTRTGFGLWRDSRCGSSRVNFDFGDGLLLVLHFGRLNKPLPNSIDHHVEPVEVQESKCCIAGDVCN